MMKNVPNRTENVLLWHTMELNCSLWLVWPFMALYDLLWPIMDFYVWPCMALYYGLMWFPWLCMTMSGLIWITMALCLLGGHARQPWPSQISSVPEVGTDIYLQVVNNKASYLFVYHLDHIHVWLNISKPRLIFQLVDFQVWQISQVHLKIHFEYRLQ